MNKKGIERNIVVLLFVLVLIVFSFAERDSRKLEKLYTTSQLLKKGSSNAPDLAVQESKKSTPTIKAMRSWLFVILLFSLSQPLSSQDTNSDMNVADSIISQTPYERLQDSLYRQRMQRSINENGKVLEQFLADFKERQEREKRQTYIRIGLGIAFVAVLIYGLWRRRKMRQQQP